MINKTGIALLAKAPVAGTVKTRFCPPCTPEQAAEFARAFLNDTAEMLKSPLVCDRVDGWCSYLGASDELAAIFGDRLLLQRGDNFGERIAYATEDLFDMDYANTMAFAADCPTVDEKYLAEALDLLDHNDVVFGPARDGGCVLVALSCRAPQVFSEVKMSTDHVLDDMQNVCKRLGLTFETTEVRYDLDAVADLELAVANGELNHAKHTLALFESAQFAPA